MSLTINRSPREADTASTLRTIVVFGASGDLAKRLLLPGLGSLLNHDPDLRIRIIGTGRRPLSANAWTATLTDAIGAPAEGTDQLAGSDYLAGDPTDPAFLAQLLSAAGAAPILYFALPPGATIAVCRALASMTLEYELTLAFEKPFGVDAATARQLNAVAHSIAAEERIHRIDHFLGRDTVLGILGLRFSNRLLATAWDSSAIELIEVVYDETLTLEGRAQYYDTAGALTDMLQSHLLQVLALLTMERPNALRADALRNAIGAVLDSTRLADTPQVASRRARYTAGRIAARDVPAYADEPGITPSSRTETLAEIELRIDTHRWSGTRFLLRSGKALGRSRKEIVVTFRPLPDLLQGPTDRVAPQTLTIGLNPAALRLTVATNAGGDPFELAEASLTGATAPAAVTPYGQILRSILQADPLLSVREDVAERSWHIVQPAIDAWAKNQVPLQGYPAGSAGPSTWH